MWDEFQNALAWYRAAPQRWIVSAQQDLSAAAQWIWEVIQGDFNEDQSSAQVVTGTVISMIPLVDQICDVRDVVANCRKIRGDSSNKWAWIALVLTLIGLFPVLGSLAKGCLKIPLSYGRRAALRGAASAFDSDIWKATRPAVEAGIVKLNAFLGRPEVRKTLAALRIDNPWKYLADQVRRLAGQVNVGSLLKAFDAVIDVLEQLLAVVRKWGGEAINTRAGRLLKDIAEVRREANRRLAEVLQPAQHWLDKLARRLDVEADMNYRAVTNAINPHSFRRPTIEAEREAFERNRPGWVDKGKTPPHPQLRKSPSKEGWPDIGDEANRPLKRVFRTFENALPIDYPAGTVLYRIVDPGSFDNSVTWMSKVEFDALTSKGEWRSRFAVWESWNRNGEYVTYTVPPGKRLRAWEGVTASQPHESGAALLLKGGARQIVLDPKDLDKAFVSKRQPTGWGYGDSGESISMLGVPVLKNNWKD